LSLPVFLTKTLLLTLGMTGATLLLKDVEKSSPKRFQEYVDILRYH
jgi:hypothetical protein